MKIDVAPRNATYTKNKLGACLGLLASASIVALSSTGSLAQSLPSKPRVLAYPGGAGGTPTPLGIGWLSDNVSATSSVCVIFQEATSQDSDAVYSTRSVVTDKFGHSQAINVSADVQVKGITGASVDAKTSYSNQTEISGSDLTVVDHITVDRGVRYAAPAAVGNVSDFANKVQSQTEQSRDPSQIQKAMNIDTNTVNQTFASYLHTRASTVPQSQKDRALSFAMALQQLNIEGKSGQPVTPPTQNSNAPTLQSVEPPTLNRVSSQPKTVAASVRLTDDMAKLATTNPTEFRRRCGDGYVASISQGGELAITYRISTSSVQRKQEVSSSLGVSYSAGVVSGSASVSVATTLKNMNESGHTSLTMYRSGGSGQPVPTSLDQIDSVISGFPAAVQSAPRNYLITVIDYRTLPNYASTAGGMKEITGYELLAWEYSKAAAVHEAATNILADRQAALSGQAPHYLFPRGGGMDGVRAAQSAASARLNAVRTVAETCIAGGSCTVSGEFDDYALRAAFPLPILPDSVGGLARALWASDSTYRAAVSSQWIDIPNTMRCLLRPGDANYCADDSKLQTARNRITPANASDVWFMLERADQPGQCLTIPMPPAPNVWATIATCPSSWDNPVFLFSYDQTSGTLMAKSWQTVANAIVMAGRNMWWGPGMARIGIAYRNSKVENFELGQSWDVRTAKDDSNIYFVVRADAPNQSSSTLVGACFSTLDKGAVWVLPCSGGAMPFRLRIGAGS